MSDRTAPCVCGKDILLTRELLDQAGRLVECPACGHELRVWQWFARANNHAFIFKERPDGQQNL